MKKGDLTNKRKWLSWKNTWVGSILPLGYFVFQISQSWIDLGTNPSVLRWLVPICLTLSVMIVFIAIVILINSRRSAPTRKKTPAESLAKSILAYGNQLQEEGRDIALINLRNKFTSTLHLLGFYEDRTQLGKLALRSAAVIRDTLTKAKIMIDDLGWTNFLLGNKKIAIDNIQRGIQIAKSAKQKEPDKSTELSLYEAKGLRHLSIIEHENNIEKAQEILAQAMEILESLKQPSHPQVIHDTAQIQYAKGLITTMSLGLHKAGQLRRGDREGKDLLSTALMQVRQSVALFRTIGDIDRHGKALSLEVRILEAMGASVEAIEVAALKDRVLAASEWIRADGSTKLTEWE